MQCPCALHGAQESCALGCDRPEGEPREERFAMCVDVDVGGGFTSNIFEIKNEFFPTPGSLPTSIGEASSDNGGG